MTNPPAIPNVQALAVTAIRTATARYLEDGDTARWERAVAAALTKGHMAAYLLGIAERVGVSIESGLVNARNMSRADRNDLKAIVADQVAFLKRFADVADTLSDAQLMQRADLYALAPKQSYWQAWAGDDIGCVPGACEECYGNCRCSLRHEDDGIYWDATNDARTCRSCAARGAMQPYAAVGEMANG